MALIACFECEREYSDTRPDCPHCGAQRHAMVEASSGPIDPELRDLLEEKRRKRALLRRAESLGEAALHHGFRNGEEKQAFSVGMEFVHGELISFTAYVDSELETAHTDALADVSLVQERTTHYFDDGSQFQALTGARLEKRSTRVLADAQLRKSRITELCLEDQDGATVKAMVRGPDLDFLRVGAPVSLGYLAARHGAHAGGLGELTRFGRYVNGVVSPIFVGCHNVRTGEVSGFLSNVEDYYSAFFSTRMGWKKWAFWGGGIALDLVTGFFPVFLAVGATGFFWRRHVLRRGQRGRMRAFAAWWNATVDEMIDQVGVAEPADRRASAPDESATPRDGLG